MQYIKLQRKKQAPIKVIRLCPVKVIRLCPVWTTRRRSARTAESARQWRTPASVPRCGKDARPFTLEWRQIYMTGWINTAKTDIIVRRNCVPLFPGFRRVFVTRQSQNHAEKPEKQKKQGLRDETESPEKMKSVPKRSKIQIIPKTPITKTS